jgi:hypothetical protein
LPFPIRAARHGLSVLPKAEDLYNFPKAEDLSFHAARRDLSVFPKAEDLFVRAARQDLSIFPKAKDLSVRAARLDLSVFPKAEDLSDFQVWDIGQVPVSNFDWLPFTPPLVAFSGPSSSVSHSFSSSCSPWMSGKAHTQGQNNSNHVVFRGRLFPYNSFMKFHQEMTL